VVTLSKNGGSFTDAVEDADSDPANEIQALNISGNHLSLSKGGGTIAVPGDNWGIQTVITDPTLSGNGITTTPLKIGITDFPYPTGYNKSNMRILTAELKESNLYWVSIGMVPYDPSPTMGTHHSFCYYLWDNFIRLEYPNEVYYHNKPFRLLVIKVQ
jgi:hypothetical protein